MAPPVTPRLRGVDAPWAWTSGLASPPPRPARRRPAHVDRDRLARPAAAWRPSGWPRPAPSITIVPSPSSSSSATLTPGFGCPTTAPRAAASTSRCDDAPWKSRRPRRCHRSRRGSRPRRRPMPAPADTSAAIAGAARHRAPQEVAHLRLRASERRAGWASDRRSSTYRRRTSSSSRNGGRGTRVAFQRARGHAGARPSGWRRRGTGRCRSGRCRTGSARPETPSPTPRVRRPTR